MKMLKIENEYDGGLFPVAANISEYEISDEEQAHELLEEIIDSVNPVEGGRLNERAHFALSLRDAGVRGRSFLDAMAEFDSKGQADG
ncbi:hypothetical protein [Anaerohalosphaera lusitana]|uniref:hypothetical protein n=1 Tax=Anaerohalosphaera lusitana TaxID=1936003 RepID=UPI0011BA8887|nr:hypothetical protein [Anaerohalosphaera lusitana]